MEITEIIEGKKKIKKIETKTNKYTIKKISATKRWFFEKINKINKL